MKKVGLLLLALVVVMGSLGVGYAMWSDTIVVSGTVETGTVEVNLDGTYSGTWVYKTANHGSEIVNEANESLGELIASATASGNTETNIVAFSFDNLFPIGQAYSADFDATYNGSIPVHLVWDWRYQDGTGIFTPSLIPDLALKELLYYYTTITYTVTPSTGSAYSGTVAPPEATVIQLHQGDKINISVNINIPQEWVDNSLNTSFVTVGANTKDDLAGKNFQFIGKFIAYQWNESAPAVTIP